MYYEDKECEIVNTREINDKKYYDILLPERNVELKSLSSISKISSEIVEKDYAIYVKDDFMEIVYVNKIDIAYNYAFVQIYKSNVLSHYILEN